MIIKADKEGAEMVRWLCDIGLKQSGIAGLKEIVSILNSIQLSEKTVEPMTETTKQSIP